MANSSYSISIDANQNPNMKFIFSALILQFKWGSGGKGGCYCKHAMKSGDYLKKHLKENLTSIHGKK